ncbi:MAG: hypothetical protein U5L72_03030 [Bacteroidales bacterium]|nr:hypothetical protein [Bacteroidales bacterium]
MDWGAIPGKEERDYGDVQIVNYAREFLAREHDEPCCSILGTYRPHISLACATEILRHVFSRWHCSA